MPFSLIARKDLVRHRVEGLQHLESHLTMQLTLQLRRPVMCHSHVP